MKSYETLQLITFEYWLVLKTLPGENGALKFGQTKAALIKETGPV